MRPIAAYFASGTSPMNLESWGLEKLILVDKTFSRTEMNGNVWKLKCDAFEAVDILKEKGIKLDIFISINEGLSEGGPDYPLNGEYFLAYAMPILNGEYYHIYSADYYRGLNPRYLSHHLPKLPYRKELITDFNFNLNLLNNGGGGYSVKVYKMTRNIDMPLIHPLFCNITLHRKSIWEEADTLKGLFLPENTLLKYLNNYSEKIISFTKMEFPLERLYNCGYTKGDVIGVVPWRSANYKAEFEQLNTFAKLKGFTIKIFYLDPKDIKKLEMY